MQYCKKCVLPTTRPGIKLNENGICGGCLNNIFEEEKINWDDRLNQFNNLVEEIKKKECLSNHCVVPVRGKTVLFK